LIFTETSLKGAYVIDIEKIEDNRGFFARTWEQKKFEEMGLISKIIECSISFNLKKGTVRGMHYQIESYAEVKLVSCQKGKIFDVILDLRKNSSTFKKWSSFELSEKNHKILYIPEGFAHGFQTLEDNTEVSYQISNYYNPDMARSILWNDPTFNIKWPLPVSEISSKDANLPLYKNNSS